MVVKYRQAGLGHVTKPRETPHLDHRMTGELPQGDEIPHADAGDESAAHEPHGAAGLHGGIAACTILGFEQDSDDPLDQLWRKGLQESWGRCCHDRCPEGGETYRY